MKNTISYFADCYFADKNRKYIKDIFAKDIELLSFVSGKEELINGFFPFISLESDYAENLSKKAYIYRKEKEIIYCTGLIVGIKWQEQISDFFCSPLLTQNANILQNEDDYSVELQSGTLSFNDMLIETITEEDTHSIADFQDLLTGEAVLSNNSIATITRLLEERVPAIKTLEFTQFPELTSEKRLKEIIKSVKAKKEDYFELIPCSFIALANKPNEARGVVEELNRLIEINDYSQALTQLFILENKVATSPESNTCFVPAILSRAQEAVMHSVNSSVHTLIIGPPGTGKSYTIASLAMEQLSRGKSVLIASKMNQAVDVIADKINKQLNISGCIVRGGKQSYLKELKDFLKRLLNSMYKDESIDKKTLATLKKEILNIDSVIKKTEQQLKKKSRKEIKIGNLYAKKESSIFVALQKWLLKFGSKKQLWQIFEDYDALLNQKINRISRYTSENNTLRINQSLKQHRTVLNTFLQAISSRTGGKQEDLFNSIDFSVLLQIFPVWLVNLSDIHKVLPLQKELFDVVIIDEATQCDIASCLPSLQRAKKAVIAGDPNQLRHISFLSKAKQSEFLAKYDMAETMEYDYRNTSVLDLFSEKIASQQSVVFLNEHYRSLPEIISFSNKEFYDRRLKIMTEKPINYGHHPVVFNFCEDGKREEAGYNKSETEWIIKKIKEIVESDIMETPSIGVLSPFRKQVDYISSEIMKHFPLQTIDKHNILVGTAHSFQGEERDIMFISLSLDTDSHSAAYRFMEIPNVFNVAITRAKSKQYIVHSIRKESLKSGSLLHKFFDFYSGGVKNNFTDSNENYDHFAAAIIDRLNNMNLRVLSAVPIAGHTMDLVVTNGDKALGIDLIGFPGDFADAYPIERYKMFNRAGLKVIPITYSDWCEMPEACILHIQQNLT